MYHSGNLSHIWKQFTNMNQINEYWLILVLLNITHAGGNFIGF